MAPCCDTSSISAWPACGRLWMSARRYHDERCQKRLAAASASAWVASSRAASARYGASAAGSIGRSARMFSRLNASVVGQIALLPKPSASRWYWVRPAADPLPEKTVTIVTFWPSSRRLAISPPQESATSSGWGATKTWVMARRVYRRRLPRSTCRLAGGPAQARGRGRATRVRRVARPVSGTRPPRAAGRRRRPRGSWSAAGRRHAPRAAAPAPAAARPGSRAGRRPPSWPIRASGTRGAAAATRIRGQGRLPGTPALPSPTADLHRVAVPERRQAGACARREVRDPLDAGDAAAHRGQHRGLVAGAGSRPRAPARPVRGASSWVMSPTMSGWLIVCSCSIGRASSA